MRTQSTANKHVLFFLEQDDMKQEIGNHVQHGCSTFGSC